MYHLYEERDESDFFMDEEEVNYQDYYDLNNEYDLEALWELSQLYWEVYFSFHHPFFLGYFIFWFFNFLTKEQYLGITNFSIKWFILYKLLSDPNMGYNFDFDLIFEDWLESENIFWKNMFWYRLYFTNPIKLTQNFTQSIDLDTNLPAFKDEKIIDETNLDLENLKLGDTFYRIVPENDKGEAVAHEATGRVRTLLPSPPDESLKTIDKDAYQVMKWDAVPYAEVYEVTYTHDKNSDEKIVEYVKNNRLKVDNKTGFLQWKVRVVEPETNKRLSSFSKTVDWYDAAKRLASLHGTGQAGRLYPKITKPESRKTFISINNSPLFIVMAWTYEQEATAYDVEISKTPDMSKLVFKKKVSNKRRAVINQKFKPGIYYMRVRANHESIVDESWSESEVFRVINRNMK